MEDSEVQENDSTHTNSMITDENLNLLATNSPIWREFKEAVRILNDLVDMQNDAPLETYRKEWEQTMKEAYDFLDKHEKVWFNQ